jgi:mRNA-degrading endonuclease RelE of RelBE toxin-antitoxin system
MAKRLRTGRYRVFYTIDEERRVVQVDHVARLT